jgi:hypothetical protein
MRCGNWTLKKSMGCILKSDDVKDHTKPHYSVRSFCHTVLLPSGLSRNTSTLYLATCLIDILQDCYSSLHNFSMQTNVNVADQNAPNPHGDNYDQLSDTYVIRQRMRIVRMNTVTSASRIGRSGTGWFGCGVAITGCTKIAYPSTFSMAVVPLVESRLLR